MKNNITPKDIVSYMGKTFAVSEINWAQQITLTKNLLKKYTPEEIIYALNYHKQKGVKMYSIGFLFRNMTDPIKEMKATKNIIKDDKSGERNKERVRRLRQTKYRAEYPEHLFTESGEDD